MSSSDSVWTPVWATTHTGHVATAACLTRGMPEERGGHR